MIKIVYLILATVVFNPFVFAETVVMNSGDSYEGDIIDRNDQFITIRTGGAPVYLPVDQIKQIVDKVPQPSLPDVTPQPEIKDQPYDQGINSDRFPPVQLESTTPPEDTQAQVMVENFKETPIQTTNPPANVSDSDPKKLIDGHDSQYYDEQSKKSLEAGDVRQALVHYSYAYSLGVKDTDGLRQKLREKADELGGISKNALEYQILEDDNELTIDPQASVANHDGRLQEGAKSPMGKMPAGWFIYIAAALLGMIIFHLKGKKEPQNSSTTHLTTGPESAIVHHAKEFMKAGPNKRVCAYLLDSILILLISSILGLALPKEYGWLIVTLYLLFKDCVAGQSIGKRIVGIQIIDSQGNCASSNRTVVRNLPLGLLGLIMTLNWPLLIVTGFVVPLTEYLTMVYSRNGQRIISDQIASTRVQDLKPQISDKTYLLISLGVIVLLFLIIFALGAVLGKAA